jgi:hypothetical protein
MGEVESRRSRNPRWGPCDQSGRRRLATISRSTSDALAGLLAACVLTNHRHRGGTG